MQAKRLLFPNIREVVWETYEIPNAPEPHTFIVKAKRSLISAGTELAIYTGSHIGFSLPNPPFPLIPNRPGYAMMGEVIAVGADVKDVCAGQRVMAEVSHSTFNVINTRCDAYVVLPDGVRDDDAPLIRMAKIGLTAIRLAPAQLGEAVVVYGLGMVGELAAQLYRLNGVRPVIGIDQIPSRLALAASHQIAALNPHEADVKSKVNELTRGRGAEIVVEATGNPAVVPLALDVAAEGGRVLLLGSARGNVEIDAYSLIHRKGITIIGAHERTQSLDSISHGRLTRQRNYEVLADLFASGDLKSEGLITHRITPTAAPQMYEALAKSPQDYMGVLIEWN